MKINFVLAAEPLKLQSHKCWRLGMIVHELITNAARHAFAGRKGEIRVELSRAGALVECRVLDNGSALGNVRPGRGLKIIDELTKGLGGRFEQRFGSQGSISIIVFPCDNGQQTTMSKQKVALAISGRHPDRGFSTFPGSVCRREGCKNGLPGIFVLCTSSG